MLLSWRAWCHLSDFHQIRTWKKKKNRKNKTKQKNSFHVLTWILGVILSVQLERKKKTHPTRGQACFPVFCQHTASEVCEEERKRQLTLSTNLHFLFSCHLHAAQVLKTSISCYSPESQHQLQQDPSAQQSLSWNLQPTPNSFIYLFILKNEREEKRERVSARARKLGSKNRLESANISHAHLTTPRAGLGRGESEEFSFDYLFDSCEQWVNVQETRDHMRWQAVGFEAGRAHWLSCGAAHQPVSARSCWWEQWGEEPPWEVTAGGRTSYKMLLEEGDVCHQLLRSGQLALFPPAPKGLRIEA